MASIAVDDRSWPHDYAVRLYEEHTEWLLRYCRRQLGDRADAEDAAQTTFLYAFRALRRGVVPECERAWLTTIARNACHSQRRTAKRRPDTTELDVDRIALAQPDLEEAGFMDDVRAALAGLPEKQRRALVLREWHGASSDEIASELHLSEPATHALLFRARRSFATALAASRRPVAGLNVAFLLDQVRAYLKPLLGGTAVKAAVVTTAAGVVVGGVVLEQRADGGSPPSAPPVATVAVAPSSALVPAARSIVPLREVNPRLVPARPRVDTPARALRDSTQSTALAVAPDGETAGRFARPLTPFTAAPTTSSPPNAGAPSQPAPPLPLPPVEPPVPAPVDLPPILGGDPPVELPPPVDELLPPVEVPPVDPPPLPAPPLP